MDAPSSSAIPIPTFGDNGQDVTPESLKEFLRTEIVKFNPRLKERASSEQVAAWITIVNHLFDMILSSFPSPSDFPWETLHERLTLTETSLEFIHLCVQCVDGLFTGQFAVRMTARLLSICCSLDVWIHVQIPDEDGVAKPRMLREKAFDVLLLLLRSLGGNTAVIDKVDEPAWRTLEHILKECMDIGRDLISLSPTLLYPTSIQMFQLPRVVHELPSSAEARQFLLISVERASDVPMVISLLLTAVNRTLYPPLPSQRFFMGVAIRAVESCHMAYAFISSSSCLTTANKRMLCLSQVAASLSPLSSIYDGTQLPIAAIVHGLLICWINADSREYINDLDFLLRSLADVPFALVPHTPRLGPFIQAVGSKDWGNASAALRVSATMYVQRCISQLNSEELEEAEQVFKRPPFIPSSEPLLESIRSRLKIVARTSHEATDISGPSWKSRVCEAVSAIVAPDATDTLSEGVVISKEKYVASALDHVKSRFIRPLSFTAANERIALARQLSALVSLLSHDSASDCSGACDPLDVEALPVFSTVISRLFDGPDRDVTALVRVEAYNVLANIVNHDLLRYEDGQIDHLMNHLRAGMLDRGRSVRLASGRLLASLCRGFQREPKTSARRADTLFSLLYEVLGSRQDGPRETALLTLGFIGKSADGDILGKVVCSLVGHLGSSNLILNGIAFMQLKDLASSREKSPHKLIDPYMSDVAPLAVSRMISQPSLLHQLCQLISMSQVGFLSMTLRQTLPPVYADCNAKVLEKIAQSLEEAQSALFLANSEAVLAHVFLLPAPTRMQKALDFILQTLHPDARSAVPLVQIIRASVVDLLTTLVTALGVEDEERRTAALTALQRVGDLLSQDSEQGTSSNHINHLLAKYMRGIVNKLTGMLQDFRGRQPIESKRPLLRALDALLSRVGPDISAVAPQVVASMQALLVMPELSEATLSTWQTLLSSLRPEDMGPFVGVTTASFVAGWSTFSPAAQEIAQKTIEYLICDNRAKVGHHLEEAADLTPIPQLRKAQKKLKSARISWTSQDRLRRMVDRVYSDNTYIALRALTELKEAIQGKYSETIRMMSTGDVFDTMVGQLMTALLSAASREGDGITPIHLLAFECIGALGALDPDRLELGVKDSRMIVFGNFCDEEESLAFSLHLVQDVLVSIYRSTGDLLYQNLLAYTIQELLKFCKFDTLVDGRTPNAKVRKRWQSLPKHVIETVSPLLGSGYSYKRQPRAAIKHPIYLDRATYREWMQIWAGYLIDHVSGVYAQSIFEAFQGVIRMRDAALAQHVLPHLVLNILISGNHEEGDKIRAEMLAVLEDQLDANSTSTADKKLLSAQTVFGLLEHLNNWVRVVRQDKAQKKTETRRSRTSLAASQAEEQLLRLDSILSSIDRDLLAKAALKCRAYALSLMNFEQQVVGLRAREPSASLVTDQSQDYFERLHEIYAHLDEPDGMEGISTLIVSPSLEHQIRQHESTGKWTSAQSCWEVRLQQSPNQLEYHLGLLRCLRNLGHYDTLRTHVKGVLTRNPDWEPALAGFQVESAWMVGDWDDVKVTAKETKADSPQIAMARLLLSLRAHDDEVVASAMSEARLILGAPISSSGARGYRSAHDSLLDLHLVHELEMINKAVKGLVPLRGNELSALSQKLNLRLDSTLPTFRNRERVLSMRRTAFEISPMARLDREIIGSWVNSAKLARKAAHWQTAYSAILQAHHDRNVPSLIERAKLVKAMGEPLRALQELENSLLLCGVIGQEVIDITMDDPLGQRIKAKAQMLRARWMKESERYEVEYLRKIFQAASETYDWESGHFHYGQYMDEHFKELGREERRARGAKIVLAVIKEYVKAIRIGTKYIYQTVPRLLTLWLDMGEDRHHAASDVFRQINVETSQAIQHSNPYKWYTAFPQIVSRVGHTNLEVYALLAKLIQLVIIEYPKQALWLFASVVKSKANARKQRGMENLAQLREISNRVEQDVAGLIEECNAMTDQLLAVCEYPLGMPERKVLSVKHNFPHLARLAPSKIIIPLQSSLTASMPPASSQASEHIPFPVKSPTFHQFFDEIDVMRTLAKPRKITVRGDDGVVYSFLGKPKDDLRKDARLMDFNAIINKILKATSESRRRQLHIRTYGVVTLSEECGFIQWVPNTIPMRMPLAKYYEVRNVQIWNPELVHVFNRIKVAKDQEAVQIFAREVLPTYPPIFHEWFLETFPEPSAWLASRLAYGRTAAVMAMVGFVLGLGDRHSENILLDVNTGDVVHVDFNCLFDKGKQLDTPERVPFRLTHNVVDGLGITGVEGVFRIACELTIQLLRDNRDTLMSVLDAFVHDPIVEWEDDKKKLERTAQRRGDKNAVKASTDLRDLAKNALTPIEKKLKGIYTPGSPTATAHARERASAVREKEVTTSNLVQMLIQEATDPVNLAKMYVGWGPYF